MDTIFYVCLSILVIVFFSYISFLINKNNVTTNNTILNIWFLDNIIIIWSYLKKSKLNFNTKANINVIYDIYLLFLILLTIINNNIKDIVSTICIGNWLIFLWKGYTILNIPVYGIPSQQPAKKHANLEIPYTKGNDIIDAFINLLFKGNFKGVIEIKCYKCKKIVKLDKK